MEGSGGPLDNINRSNVLLGQNMSQKDTNSKDISSVDSSRTDFSERKTFQ